ncbi:Os02g0185633, partial [Oryza sativa Japonica Group]
MPPMAPARRHDGNRSSRLNPEPILTMSASSSRNSSRRPNLSPIMARIVASVITAVIRSLTFTASPRGDAATAATRRRASSSRTRRNDRTRRAPSSSTTHSLRSWRHSAPYVANTTPSPSHRSRRVVGFHGRVANATSCVLMISLAASADEATTTGTSPSLSDMSGASSRRARSAMVRCTSGPRAMTWWRLPTSGSRHGPGGSLSAPLSPRRFAVNLTTMRASKRKQAHHA